MSKKRVVIVGATILIGIISVFVLFNPAQGMQGFQSAIFTRYLPLVSDSSYGPAPTPTAEPVPTNTPEDFLETFDEDPDSPEPFQSPDWDVAVQVRGWERIYDLEEMDADHGADCEPFPATHSIDQYEDTVYLCKNHLMTAINDSGYAVITLTPNHMLDFSEHEAVVTFDMSTLRRSTRDWVQIWITPFDEYLHHPNIGGVDLQGVPQNAVSIKLTADNSFIPILVRDFVTLGDENDVLPGVFEWIGYDSFLEPSALVRDTFELRISKDHIKFGMPGYDFYWMDIDIDPALTWDSGIIQIAHYSYDPYKACDYDGTCGPNTWHWDNFSFENGIPFEILKTSNRYANSEMDTLVLDTPALGSSYLRFSGIGSDLEVSWDGGDSWNPAVRQVQELDNDGHFSSYWMPIPEGTSSITFRGNPWWGGDWHVRDAAVWVIPGY